MPSTGTWGIPYPALSDTPNGPVQMQSLANSVDTLFTTFQGVDNAITAALNGLLTNRAGTATVATNESRSNATFGDLATVGPTVTVTSLGTKALVIWGCTLWGSVASASGRVAVDISGATTLAAAYSNGVYGSENAGLGNGSSGATARMYTINPGANTFKLKYNNIAANGTAFFEQRFIVVFAP